jgi:hypothetical protein
MTNDTKTELKNLRGKYIKQLLSQLESLGVLTPDMRKLVLDNINDLMRDVLRELGYDPNQ